MNLKQIRLSLIIIVAIFAVSTGIPRIVKPVPAQSESSAMTMTTTTTTTAATDSLSSGPKFIAKMTGDQEVPPVNTKTTGAIKLAAATNSQQQNVVDYDLTLTNLNGTITGADIHIGKQGANGPIVADLDILSGRSAAVAASSSSEGSTTMTSSSISGTIRSADLKGPLEGKQISDLVKLIEEDRTYANINTEQYPKGEIRGQLSSYTPSSSPVSTLTAKSPSAFASATATP